MSFCAKCNNRMKREFLPDELIMQCQCGYTRTATDDETLIQTEMIESGPEFHQNILATAYKDVANPMDRRYCPECKKNILVRYVRITNQMHRIFVCPAGHTFEINE